MSGKRLYSCVCSRVSADDFWLGGDGLAVQVHDHDVGLGQLALVAPGNGDRDMPVVDARARNCCWWPGVQPRAAQFARR